MPLLRAVNNSFLGGDYCSSILIPIPNHHHYHSCTCTTTPPPPLFSLRFFTLPISNPNHYYYPFISLKTHHHHHRHHGRQRFQPPRSHHHHRHHHHLLGDFLQASLLLSETAKHYHLRKQGFQQEVKPFAAPAQLVPFSAPDVNSIGLGLLRRFHNPTIFLKISCQGDYLLPIVVSEYAVETLIHSFNDSHNGDDYTSHFHFAKDLVLELGHEVKMVKITKKMVNTYFASVYIGKVGESESFNVDACPSDAINVAKMCKAPIYVNKDIVLTDAIGIASGTGRVRDTKPIYDVLLDSPTDSPDLLVEELNLVQNLKMAVEQERYNDAAMWKDKLVKLWHSGL